VPVLSEAESKRLLAGYGIPFPPERAVRGVVDAVAAAEDIGFPVAIKASGPGIAHKSERGLVRLNVASAAAAEAAATALLHVTSDDNDGDVELLVAPMVAGSRELIVGVHRDETFGMVVILGVGGVLAEAVAHVSCRLVPIDRLDAAAMIEDLGVERLLGRCRGEPAVDRDALADVLLALSRAVQSEPTLVSADLNPLIVAKGRPVAVDALVEIAEGGPDAHP
jgi:acetyl-CoA synthetase (ADP-forming)